MTAVAARLGRPVGSFGRRLVRFWSGINAVSIKELRGRMRGRRAFAVLTVYLLLLGLFAFAIYVYLKSQATQIVVNSNGFDFPIDRFPGFPGGMPFPGGQTLSNGTALSAGIGHGIFGGLLFLETLLVLVLAPAFTTGAISLEREKQTIDMLVTTPLSTLGMVIGKLFSALVYVLLLIVASIPLASLVFVFGGVGPEDLLRAYVFLFALAFGMGAIGLFISALVRRTQTATVITFVVVLLLSIGTGALHQFWQVTTRPASSSTVITQRPGRAPEAALWLNPFVADLDMICATSPDAYHLSCEYISGVTGRPYFGSPTNTGQPGVVFPMGPGVQVDDAGGVVIKGGQLPAVAVPAPECPPNARCGAPPQKPVGLPVDDTQQAAALSLGFPRDTFWPKSAAAFVGVGVVLTLLSAQLVSPTRRLRIPRPHMPARRRGGPPPADPDDSSTTTDIPPAEAQPSDSSTMETSA